MESLLFRTASGSIPVQSPAMPATLHRHSSSLSVQAAAVVAGVFSGEKNGIPSPRVSLHMEISRRSIRRSYSESDVVRSEFRTLSKLGSRSFAALPELECEEICTDEVRGYAGGWPASGSSCEEVGGFPGGGMNKDRNSGGGGSGGNGSDADGQGIGAYYQATLKSDPGNALLLRNYAKYLHEVERDVVKAEEYYGRAILASPGDGEVLSLYGKLIWESYRDEKRARSYFNQALQASPNDCMIMGSYAHFLWETEEEEEEEETERGSIDGVATIAAMVEAF